MGFGIASLFAKFSFEVSVYDPKFDPGKQTEGSGIRWSSDLASAVADADLVVETVTEKLEIKRELYRQLETLILPHTIVVSNTSSFALEVLSEGLSFADRMLIMHFFNPADVVPLVELVKLPSTPAALLEETAELLRSCAKAPVVLKKDIPGFIGNRLQAAILREALHLLENGVADADAIDTVVREGIGLRWALKGPFEVADAGGLDVWAKVAGNLFPELGSGTASVGMLERKVAQGELGVKSGRGFYGYESASGAAEEMSAKLAALVALKRNNGAK